MSLLESACRRVSRFAATERMFRGTRKVLVAYSGGPDSTACLLVLLRLRESLGFEVAACHFDHQLRDSSAAETQQVRALCESMGVDCFTGEGDVRGVARQQRQGIEATARTMRYQFLAFVAGKELADCIATGHTADDQAETVLMRVIRGSGVRGIRGMLPVSGVPGAEAQRLVRPLLTLTRSETEGICAEAGIAPLADPSNADTAFTRNRVRAQTLSALRELNPSIDRALIGLAESAREIFLPVEKQVMALAPTQRGPVGATFALSPVAALQSEALTLLIEREAAFYRLDTEVNRTRLANLRSVLRRGSGRVRFGEAEAEASCGQFRIGPALEATEPFETAVLNVPGITRAGPWRVDVSTEPLADGPDGSQLAITTSGTSGAFRARPLRAGDRMIYHGIDRKVADIVANAKIPAWERHGIVAIADSKRVLGLIGAFGTIADPVDGEDALYVRLTQLPPR